MRDYIIFTDSACDIKPEILAEWGVKYCSLTLRFTGEDKEYLNDEIDVKEFYDKMRAGGVAKTAAINSETFVEAFEKILKEGKDILYLGFYLTTHIWVIYHIRVRFYNCMKCF